MVIQCSLKLDTSAKLEIETGLMRSVHGIPSSFELVGMWLVSDQRCTGRDAPKCTGLQISSCRARSRPYRSNILQGGKFWPRSTQCTPLHRFGIRSLISKFPLKTAEFFAVFFQNLANFAQICQIFAEFSPKLTKFFRDFPKMQHFSKMFNFCC